MGMIDTLALSHKLEHAGMERTQSEALAAALSEGLSGAAATKDDVDASANALKLYVQSELAPMRADLAVLKWTALITAAGILSLVFKAFG